MSKRWSRLSTVNSSRGAGWAIATAAAIATSLSSGQLAAQPAPTPTPTPRVVPPPPVFGAGAPAAVAAPAAIGAAAGASAAATTVAPPPSILNEDNAVVEEALDKNAPFRAACVNAEFLTAHTAELTGCYGDASKATWAELATKAKTYTASHCGAAATKLTDAETKSNADVLAATKAVADAVKAQRDAGIALDEWRKSDEKGATEKRIESAKAKQDADAKLAVAQAELETTKAAAAAAQVKGQQSKRDAMDEFHAAVSKAENSAISQDAFESIAGFEALVKDEKRRNICLGLRQSERDKLAGASGAKDAGDEQRKIDDGAAVVAADQHAADSLRRSQGTASATTTTSSLIENPGSPDKLAFSILSALGADQKTTGNQTVLNLNLSSLFWPDENERLKQPAWQRNLFVRGAFPLSSTDKVSQTGAAAVGASTGEAVSRFSVLLGGSFIDETDTRLPDAKDCYKLAAVYVPFPQTLDEAKSRSEQRKLLYDVCAHVAAQKTRLAWRAGMGFFTPNNVDTPKTRPELGVGAIVWGPTSWLYVNLLYQGLIKPDRIDNIGAGFSFAGNMDGTRSGVNAVARVGLDFMFLLNYSHADKSTDWEMRIAPTVRGKLFGNSMGTLAVGPRFIGSKLDSPGLLATVALTYDADTLVNSLLTPASAGTK